MNTDSPSGVDMLLWDPAVGGPGRPRAAVVKSYDEGPTDTSLRSQANVRA